MDRALAKLRLGLAFPPNVFFQCLTVKNSSSTDLVWYDQFYRLGNCDNFGYWRFSNTRLLFENRFYMFILLHKINTLCFGGATKVELQQVGIFLTLNFLPWAFLLIKKSEIERPKTP